MKDGSFFRARKDDALCDAARDGNVDLVRDILESTHAGANPNATKETQDGANPRGASAGDLWTPLLFAASNSHLEVVRLLLDDPRVDVNFRSQPPEKFSALELAMEYDGPNLEQSLSVFKAILRHPRLNIDITRWSVTTFACERLDNNLSEL